MKSAGPLPCVLSVRCGLFQFIFLPGVPQIQLSGLSAGLEPQRPWFDPQHCERGWWGHKILGAVFSELGTPPSPIHTHTHISPSQSDRRKPALSSFFLLGFVVPETIHLTFYLELTEEQPAVSVGPARAPAFPAFSLDTDSGMCLLWKY